MWKTVCFRLRLAGETTANFNNVRSNFSSTGPCIEKTTRGDDSIGSPIRRYKGNRYVGQPIAGPSTPKPKLKADVEFPMVFKYHQQRRRQQNGPYEWPLYKYVSIDISVSNALLVLSFFDLFQFIRNFQHWFCGI